MLAKLSRGMLWRRITSMILPEAEPRSPFESVVKLPENLGAYFKFGVLGWVVALLLVWLVIRILDRRHDA